MQKPHLLTFITLLLILKVFAQGPYPRNDFRSPVDKTLVLSGNFGEIRPNHFHAGFDIRTNNREGMPIYAVADGYVSRIKISAYGYGKALYITHSNGYTSVYGHLKSFKGDIGTLCKNSQSQRQSYEIDTILTESLLPVKKGELIGFSGNTGGSQGPHLHFEIRDTKTEMPVNPYFFGYVIPDTVKPRIVQLSVYPLDGQATVNGKHISKKIAPVHKKGNYTYLKQDTLLVNGKIGFGIECYDTENRSANKNGVYSIELQSGGKRIYYHELEKFTFENARYVNAHIDYESKQKHGNSIQKCYVSKNNKAGIYKEVINSGVIDFADDSVHWMRFIVKDFAGNTTELMLKVKSTSVLSAPKPRKTGPDIFDCLIPNQFNSDDLKISIPAEALYDDELFTYTKPGSAAGTYSPMHKIMSEDIALQKNITISIKPVKLPDSLQSKACIVSINKKGGKSYEGGKAEDGWITTQTKEFGIYAVGIDTTAPKLKPVFANNKSTITDLSKAKMIRIQASDNLSGVRKYRATIDGNWVLMEYEFKQNLLFYTFDESLPPGKHIFSLEVTDDKSNRSVLTFSFKR